MDIYKIVLTGGPSGGKTTILKNIANKLRKEGYNVFIVPETARTFLEGGINANPKDREYTLKFQNFILKEQLAREEYTEEFAKMINNSQKTIIIYDRAIMDNRAYLESQEDFEFLLRQYNLSEKDVINRYDLVIHLVSLATTDKNAYIKDDERTESPDEAKERDEKTGKAWLLHRNMKIIMPTRTIEEKEEITMSHISDFLEHKQEIDEHSFPLTQESEQFLLQGINKDNSKTVNITEYILSIGSIKSREHHLMEIEHNGEITYVLEMYFLEDNEKYCFETNILNKAQFEEYLNNYRVYKKIQRTETKFIRNFQICKLWKDENNTKIIFENNRNKETLLNHKRKSLVYSHDLW